DKKKAKARQVAEKPGEEEEPAKDLMEVVFIVRGDTVQMSEVKTGIQDDTYIQVTSGLQEGEEVVVAPYAAIARKLEQGSEVHVVKEEELYKKD
ncbi:MAG: HlyD family secretion protein, partial [Phaeodactylibacter sp.]|nr:HlyD family secretion protein [Phaeodactylibacter sp.]